MERSASGRQPDRAGDPVGKIQRTLRECLEPRLSDGQRLCVGLSGGRDSVVLLHALAALRSSGLALTLSAVHVHHGLSPHADDWARFCTVVGERCSIPLEVVRVRVPAVSREGPEAAARRERYVVFADRQADWLVLAHQRDDQAETILFRLLRGAGVGGAAGMPVERPLGEGPRLLRPLLGIPRATIAAYAEACSLVWIDDESNTDGRHRRNHLRHEVLPRIQQMFPGAARALVRAGEHFCEAAVLLDELARADRASVAGPDGRIEVSRFNDLSPPRARNLLRFELVSAGLRPPETRWLREAMRQLGTAGADAEICVATSEGEIHVYRRALHVVTHRQAVPVAPVCWHGEAELPWGGGRLIFRQTTGAGIDRSLLDQAAVHLAVRCGGERLQPSAKRPTRYLRKLLQEAAIPPWERARLPLLWCGGRLVWVPGIGVDAAFACPPAAAGLLPLWEDEQPASAGSARRRCA
ncbi:tRNA lysidine(34) synthetase TilS [Accumulibacter sp.]|uniref:tRNA lysidine(34) synthetase TilS n=1 Tax=Accumulibacter sp. TaxID=2053492 RepID=UPI0025D1412C|nr:tRNA lysidine(34) synthetase TilS [Accumulibacter sp.]MCM8625360.1 tRNA lysidine(34) synthetase TilS [Accumulibacter sp.]